MQKKSFKSRLFNKTISDDDDSYWQILYAEVLFRLQELKDINCKCGFCLADTRHLNYLMNQMVRDNHFSENKKPTNFAKIEDCGRKLNPIA